MTQWCHRRYETLHSATNLLMLQKYSRLSIIDLGKMVEEKTRVQKSREIVPLLLLTLLEVTSTVSHQSQYGTFINILYSLNTQQVAYYHVREQPSLGRSGTKDGRRYRKYYVQYMAEADPAFYQTRGHPAEPAVRQVGSGTRGGTTFIT